MNLCKKQVTQENSAPHSLIEWPSETYVLNITINETNVKQAER